MTTGYTYDNMGRVTNVTTGSATTGNVQDLDYEYSYGNVHRITDNTVIPADDVVFEYDSLNRLASAAPATPNSGGYYASYEYYPDGRLGARSEGSVASVMEYIDPLHLQAPTSMVSSNYNDSWNQYDANGNLVKSNGLSLAYDGDNRLIRRDSADANGYPTTTYYTYDDKGNLAAEGSSEGGWTYYAGGIYEQRSDGRCRVSGDVVDPGLR